MNLEMNYESMGLGLFWISRGKTSLISWEMEDMPRNDKVAVKIIIRRSNILDLCF